MARYAVRQSRDRLDLEDGLGRGRERQGCLEGVPDAMLVEERDKISRRGVLVDKRGGLFTASWWDVYPEAVG
jgi:hypothetical protein